MFALAPSPARPWIPLQYVAKKDSPLQKPLFPKGFSQKTLLQKGFSRKRIFKKGFTNPLFVVEKTFSDSKPLFLNRFFLSIAFFHFSLFLASYSTNENA
jgi:hypothetical protein